MKGAKEGRRIAISGFHDASGDAAANEELAKQRAFAVRDLLVAAGAPADRIECETRAHDRATPTEGKRATSK